MSGDPYRGSAGPGDPGSWNRYAYVLNDPVNYWDPRGLDAELITDASGDLVLNEHGQAQGTGESLTVTESVLEVSTVSDPMTVRYIDSWNYWLMYSSNYDQTGWEPEEEDQGLEADRWDRIYADCVDDKTDAAKAGRTAALGRIEDEFLSGLYQSALDHAAAGAIGGLIVGSTSANWPGGVLGIVTGAVVGAVWGANDWVLGIGTIEMVAKIYAYDKTTYSPALDRIEEDCEKETRLRMAQTP